MLNRYTYRTMITDFGIYVNDVSFQQDDATCHTSLAEMDLKCQTFDGRLISRNSDVNWPPRNCYLDCFRKERP